MTAFQQAKLLEWAQWREDHEVLTPMPAGINLVDAWVEIQAYQDDVPFPTDEMFEQVAPKRE